MFSLIPYKVGDNCIKDSVIKGLFDRTVKDGIDKVVFYEGTIQTRDEFLSLVKNVGCCFYILFLDEKIIGYTWLNRFENHTARNHFCGFKEIWGRGVEAGKYAITQLINMKDKDDNYIFDLFTGFVPVWNEFAINFMFACGAKSAGTIPFAIWNDEKQKSEDAIFFFYTRGDE